MDRLDAFAILVSLLASGAGCTEAVHTLGTLPAATKYQAACSDASTLRSSVRNPAACEPSPDLGGGALPDAALLGDGSANIGRDAETSSDDACVPRRVVATRRGLNVLLVVDDSLSVVLQPEWGQLTAAMSAFVDDPANAGLGVGVVYYGTSCNPNDYAKPNVPIDVLPARAQAIKSSYPLPINGKAITPALTGALTYVRTVRVAAPDRDTVLVLITDGILDPLCGSTQSNAAQEATVGLQGTPAVSTFVIGLDPGPTLIDPADIVDMSPLDAIAAAGGTKQAVVVQVNATGNTALTDGLDNVVRQARPCQYAIPASVDATRASLEWQPSAGSAKISWAHVPDQSACGGSAGVFVSKAAPGYLELCPASCSALRAGAAGTAWVVEGC